MPDGPAAEALVSLGSNVRPQANLRQAARLIAERFALLGISSPWSTQAVGPRGQPPFVNAAAWIAAAGPPLSFRAELRAIESAVGRERTGDRFAPRPIDLDLVLYGDLVMDEDGLRLPDADLLQQAYLSVPAAEVAPDWRHPETGERLGDVAARLLAALPPAARPRRLGWALLPPKPAR